jgi:hypothetical protein
MAAPESSVIGEVDQNAQETARGFDARVTRRSGDSLTVLALSD